MKHKANRSLTKWYSAPTSRCRLEIEVNEEKSRNRGSKPRRELRLDRRLRRVRVHPNLRHCRLQSAYRKRPSCSLTRVMNRRRSFDHLICAGDRGNVGITRSPVRASILPDDPNKSAVRKLEALGYSFRDGEWV